MPLNESISCLLSFEELKVAQGTPKGVSNFEFEKFILPDVGIYLLLLKFSLFEQTSTVDPVKPPNDCF